MTTTIQQLHIAERDGDWLRVKLLLIRIGWTKRISTVHDDSEACPHCDAVDSGIGAWPDNLIDWQWDELIQSYVYGYIYRCKPLDGSKCDKLFLSHYGWHV